MGSNAVGEYRLKQVLNQLDEMATLSPRSPLLHQALHSPVDYLPYTRFPKLDDSIQDVLHEAVVETEKERDVIHNQPYRTTPLVAPGAKPKPFIVNNKVTGKPMRPTVYRPLEPKSVVATLDENRALVNRQFNSPKSLYSAHNAAEAAYEQTGVRLGAPGAKPFNPEASATLAALLADESYGQPAKYMPAPYVRQAAPPPPSSSGKYAHSTAPSVHINSVGAPTSRIAQSDSFRRLMLSVMTSEY